MNEPIDVDQVVADLLAGHIARHFARRYPSVAFAQDRVQTAASEVLAICFREQAQALMAIREFEDLERDLRGTP